MKSGWGVTLTSHPLVVPWSRKRKAIPLLPLWAVRPVQNISGCTKVHFTFTYNSTPPMGRTACTEPQCPYNGALYLYLYLYSPYGPYGLYRASVSVQRCTLPLPIPLLPLWAVGLYRAPMSVQRCTLTLPIPLLPLWAVRPVQSLSVCTTVHFTFTYTSNPLLAVRPVQSFSACTRGHFTFTYTYTPPTGRRACTEPQCLYNGALYLYLYL